MTLTGRRMDVSTRRMTDYGCLRMMRTAWPSRSRSLPRTTVRSPGASSPRDGHVPLVRQPRFDRAAQGLAVAGEVHDLSFGTGDEGVLVHQKRRPGLRDPEAHPRRHVAAHPAFRVGGLDDDREGVGGGVPPRRKWRSRGRRRDRCRGRRRRWRRCPPGRAAARGSRAPRRSRAPCLWRSPARSHRRARPTRRPR